ncbi:hypothetical protein IG631_20058 [Alternaria alternata]|nr:hypothetical protein IG631_20058 [Alternaria alternata]
MESLTFAETRRSTDVNPATRLPVTSHLRYTSALARPRAEWKCCPYMTVAWSLPTCYAYK